MILHSKFVFVHVAKTGGTSITESLDKYLKPGPREGWGWQPRQHTGDMHARYVESPGIPSFGFVRNPYDRIFSCYRDWLMPAPVRSYKRDVAAAGFENYIAHLEEFPQLKPQVTMLTTVSGKWVDHIGKFERLEEDWRQIADILGLDVILPLPHQNKSDMVPDPWTPETRARVAELYAADFQEFGYDR